MSVSRDPSIPRFAVQRCTADDAYLVLDRDNDLRPVAGPYRTQAQAVYAAYWLCDDPTSSPFTPDPRSDEVLEYMGRWRP